MTNLKDDAMYLDDDDDVDERKMPYDGPSSFHHEDKKPRVGEQNGTGGNSAGTEMAKSSLSSSMGPAGGDDVDDGAPPPLADEGQTPSPTASTPTSAVDLERKIDWLSSFRRSDPRFKILRFFNDVAQDGADNIEKQGLNVSVHGSLSVSVHGKSNTNGVSRGSSAMERAKSTSNMKQAPQISSPLLAAIFSRASVFSVWRPTSLDAIRYMMLGQAVGKGLDIKGKSAKKGKLSAFVPFLQIFQDDHKDKIRPLKKDARVRIFFQTKHDCDDVTLKLKRTRVRMLGDMAQARMQTGASRAKLFEMSDPRIIFIDEYAPRCYGLDIPERLFWEGMVYTVSISRDVGTPGEEYATGRPSVPQFQDMNFDAIRKHTPKRGKPRPVIYQYDSISTGGDPMNPLSLLMAYEEKEFKRVLPVVSDFDCFLVGTRGVNYTVPIQDDQLEVMKWSLEQIENIMSKPPQGKSWTGQWLDVLKKEARSGFHPTIPPLGFSDPKTCSIMENAIDRLSESGAVRHGAERYVEKFCSLTRSLADSDSLFPSHKLACVSLFFIHILALTGIFRRIWMRNS